MALLLTLVAYLPTYIGLACLTDHVFHRKMILWNAFTVTLTLPLTAIACYLMQSSLTNSMMLAEPWMYGFLLFCMMSVILIRVCVNVAPACVVSGNFEPLSQNIMLWLGLVVVTFGNSEENNCDHWLCHLAINPSDWRNLSPKNTKMRWFWYSWIAWRSSVIALKINLFTDRERYRKDLRPPFKKS